MRLKISTSDWSKFDLIVYEKVLQEPNVWSYQVKNQWWYVIKFSNALYIHYSKTYHKTSMTIHYKPSYAKEYIDIPWTNAKKLSNRLLENASLPTHS